MPNNTESGSFSASGVWYVLILLALVVGFALVTRESEETEVDQPQTVVYLIRHAEKSDNDPQDPDLTEAGHERAQLLATMLGDVDITRIYSTQYKRTLQTVEPLAAQKELPTETYNPRALAEFATQLRESPGRFVVSGHSNTTPMLVELLGGEPGKPIVEATEYDRLYILGLNKNGTATTSMLRFGN